MTTPRFQMSRQLYKIANQPVTPQAPPFFTRIRHSPTICHSLADNQGSCSQFLLPPAHPSSWLPHAVLPASHCLTHQACDTKQCHMHASCHEMAMQALQLCQVAIILLQPCMCAWGRSVEGHTCLFTCPPSCTHDVCAISNWLCMCAWGRMCGGACLPFHMSSLMHTWHMHHLLTGCACICVGGHVEGHTLTFPQVLPHTHTILSGLIPASLDQGWLGIQYGTRYVSPSLSDHSCTESFWVWGHSGGPNAAFGYLFDWFTAHCQSHSFCALEGASAMVYFVSSLPTPHPLTHSTLQVSAIPSPMSNPHLTSKVDLAWFVCAPWFASSHLCLPSHSLTNSIWQVSDSALLT